MSSSKGIRDFAKDVVADLKAQRKLALASGRPVDPIEATLAEYGVTFETAAPETNIQTPPPNTATPPAPAAPASVPAAQSTAAAPAAAQKPAQAKPGGQKSAPAAPGGKTGSTG